MTALQALAQTPYALNTTQSQISDRPAARGERQDNGVRLLVPIATTMRSDNEALSSVQDSLNLGAARPSASHPSPP